MKIFVVKWEEMPRNFLSPTSQTLPKVQTDIVCKSAPTSKEAPSPACHASKTTALTQLLSMQLDLTLLPLQQQI